MAIARQDLQLTSPWLNAPGSLGFRPPHTWNWPEAQGAFVTNAISYRARPPAKDRAFLPYNGGCLLHNGLPNAGLQGVIKTHARRWLHAGLPIWAHILTDSAAEAQRMAAALDKTGCVTALQIGLSPQLSRSEALEIIEAAAGELPVVVCIDLNAAGLPWLNELGAVGASAICLNGPRGALPGPNGGAVIGGRLYGPALFPLAVAAVRALTSMSSTNGPLLPVIAGCGVYRLEQGRALIDAGAWAVQLDMVLWGSH